MKGIVQPNNANYNNSLIVDLIEKMLEHNNMRAKYQILYVIKLMNVKLIV